MNLISFIAVVLAVNACSKPGNGESPDPSVPGKKLPDISEIAIGDEWPVPFEGEMTLPYSGVDEGDEIRLIPRYDKSVTYTLKCIDADPEKGAVFTAPEKFAGGMCSVVLSKKDRVLSSETFVRACDLSELEKKAGMTVYGRVVDYDGNPVPEVSVSDGVRVTHTDAEGRYWLASAKKYGYVFISVPSGYKVAVNRSVPMFFSRLRSKSSSEYELHNFILAPENNTRHRTIVFSDCHLARRTNDLNQYEAMFKPELREQYNNAQSEGVALYAIALGDLAWDEWWYKNNYPISEYYRTMSDVDVPIYSIPGNHDNDPYIADDFLAEGPFRQSIGPTYYSFNIGNIHYILMDNTIFNNSGASQGTVGNVQDYSEGFTADQMRWLMSDLENVAAGTKVVFGMHIQFTGRPFVNGDGTVSFNYSMPAEQRLQLTELLAPYDVQIISGHTHTNYTNRISGTMTEHNIAAVCGTWWWTGFYSDGRCHLNGDGSPSGYAIFDAGKTSGNSLEWKFKAASRPESYQFRAYDLNNCRISRELYCPAEKNPKVSDEIFRKYACGYDVSRSDNKILINIFNWADDWTLVVKEDGKELEVTRVDAYDPLHVIHFNMARMNTNSTALTFPTSLTSHMFEVRASRYDSDIQISVQDSFGNVHTETMKRPRQLYDMSKAETW